MAGVEGGGWKGGWVARGLEVGFWGDNGLCGSICMSRIGITDLLLCLVP